MPTFMCTKCGRKIEAEYEGCCTHSSSSCKGGKPPACCGQPMIEAIDD